MNDKEELKKVVIESCINGVNVNIKFNKSYKIN